MVTREYQGAGGLRLHLDEPLSGEMAKQVAKGHLVLVADDSGEESEPIVETSSENPDGKTQDPGGDGVAKKPNANSRVDEWRAYAVSLGMDEAEAAETTKSDLQDWVKVATGDGGSGD